MKTKWLLAAVAALLAAGAGGYVLFQELTRPRFDAAKLDEVRRGMTRQEVADLLGGPPGHYSRFWGDGPGSVNASLTIYPDASECETARSPRIGECRSSPTT